MKSGKDKAAIVTRKRVFCDGFSTGGRNPEAFAKCEGKSSPSPYERSSYSQFISDGYRRMAEGPAVKACNRAEPGAIRKSYTRFLRVKRREEC